MASHRCIYWATKSFRKCAAFERIQGNAFEIEARGSYEQRP